MMVVRSRQCRGSADVGDAGVARGRGRPGPGAWHRCEGRDQAVPRPGVAPEWTPPSWDDLVRQHSARVYRLAYRLTGNQHDAEDLTQEVFVRVFRSLVQLHPGHLRGLAAPDHHQPVPRHGPAQAADPVRGAGRRGGGAAARRRADARPGVRRPPSRHRRAAGAGGPGARIPGGGRAVRHRGPLLRGDRRHPRGQAGHGAQPHPPGPGPAPGGARPPPPPPPGAPRRDAGARTS